MLQVFGFAISSNNFIVSASGDCTLKVWDVKSGKCKQTFTGHTDYVTGCDISIYNEFVVSSSYDECVRVWDMNGKCVKNLMGHNGEVLACAFTTDTKYIISSSGDQTVHIWNFAGGSCVNIFKGHSRGVNCIAPSHDRPDIATHWPSSHHLVAVHLQLSIIEILCVTSTILPKDVQKHLVQIIIQLNEFLL